jgi:23S rRNA (uridine2552-2'-O)-methyltransferase
MTMQGRGNERSTTQSAGTHGFGSSSEKRSHVSALQPGQEFDVSIEALGHSGDGMVKLEGMTVFIKNTEIGDKVKIKITKVKETIAFAERLN